jgi:hypothetical protein
MTIGYRGEREYVVGVVGARGDVQEEHQVRPSGQSPIPQVRPILGCHTRSVTRDKGSPSAGGEPPPGQITDGPQCDAAASNMLIARARSVSLNAP